MEYRLHHADKRSPVSSRVKSGLGLCISLLVSTGVSATGQQVEITSGDCRTGVQLVARNAPLAEVLKRLSRALDFELRFEGDESRRVTVNATRPPAELVSSLSPQDSIVVTQAKDARCPGRNRVVKVWVLPSTKESAMRDTPPMTPVRAAQSSGEARPVVRELVIRGSSELEEQSQRAKAAYDDYVRTHGKPPPGVEEEAAKP